MTKVPIFTKDFLLNMGISLCCSLNYFVLLINMVGYSTSQFGATSAEAGLVAGLYVIGGLISRIIIGKYVELFGRKRMFIVGLTIGLIMSATYFFAASLPMLYAIRFLHGMAYGICSTCGSAIAAKLIPPSRRGEGLGYYYLAVTLSMAIGPFLGMYLGSTGDYNNVFYVGLAMYAVSFLFVFLMKVEEEVLTDEEIKDAKSFSFDNLFQLSALPLGITCMIFYFSYSGVLAFITQYTHGTSMADVANYFYIAVATSTLISRFTTGRIYDVHGPNVIMLPGYFSFFIGMLLFATTDSPVVFLFSGFLIGYGISIIYAVCQAIVVTKSNPKRYGVTSSTFSALVDMGSGFGPTILGIVVGSMGYGDMYFMCAFASLISLAMYWAIHGRLMSASKNRRYH